MCCMYRLYVCGIGNRLLDWNAVSRTVFSGFLSTLIFSAPLTVPESLTDGLDDKKPEYRSLRCLILLSRSISICVLKWQAYLMRVGSGMSQKLRRICLQMIESSRPPAGWSFLSLDDRPLLLENMDPSRNQRVNEDDHVHSISLRVRESRRPLSV